MMCIRYLCYVDKEDTWVATAAAAAAAAASDSGDGSG